MKHIVLALLLLPTPAFAQSYLETALQFVPENATEFSFSNWELIRADLGVTRADLSSEKAYESFARTVLEERVDVNRYGRWRNFRKSHDWGWDHRDLEWQVTARGLDDVFLHIMKFHEDFLFDDLKSHLIAQEYKLSSHEAVGIYSHELVKPIVYMDPAVHTAILEEHKLILASDSEKNIQLAIDSALGKASSFKENQAMHSLAKSWGGVDVAVLAKGSDYCSSLRFPDKEREAVNQSYSLNAYDAFGLGFRSEPVDSFLLAFAFATPEAAQADLGPRQELAELDESSYEDVFELQPAELDATNLTFTLHPMRALGDFFGITDRLYFTLCP